MTCREFWNQMPELGAEPEALEHVRECRSCSALLNDQRALAAGLRRLAAGVDRRQASQLAETRLLREFRVYSGAALQSATRRDWIKWLSWVPAAAAVIALAVFLGRGRPPKPSAPPELTSFQVAAEQGTDDSVGDSDFIPLPYSTEPVATEDADLVSVEVPPSALVALGLPVAVDGSSGLVQAVVALGQDGAVEAVRLLQ